MLIVTMVPLGEFGANSTRPPNLVIMLRTVVIPGSAAFVYCFLNEGSCIVFFLLIPLPQSAIERVANSSVNPTRMSMEQFLGEAFTALCTKCETACTRSISSALTVHSSDSMTETKVRFFWEAASFQLVFSDSRVCLSTSDKLVIAPVATTVCPLYS